MGKQITLREWLKKFKTKEVAATLNVTTACVGQWNRGFVLPDVKTMKRIRELSRGRVSIDKTVDAHFHKSNTTRYNY